MTYDLSFSICLFHRFALFSLRSPANSHNQRTNHIFIQRTKFFHLDFYAANHAQFDDFLGTTQ